MLYQQWCGNDNNLALSIMRRNTNSSDAESIETINGEYNIFWNVFNGVSEEYLNKSKYLLFSDNYNKRLFIVLGYYGNIYVRRYQLNDDSTYDIYQSLNINLMTVVYNNSGYNGTLQDILSRKNIAVTDWKHLSYLNIINSSNNNNFSVIGGQSWQNENSYNYEATYVFFIFKNVFEYNDNGLLSIVSINTNMNENSDEGRNQRLISFSLNNNDYILFIWKYNEYQLNGIIFDYPNGTIFKNEFIVVQYNISYKIYQPISVLNYQNNNAIMVSYCFN